MNDSEPKILYCRCAFAQVVPEATKNEVLDRLCDSQKSFECVADLCEMSARRDERLTEILDHDGPVKIVACYPRAVKWLFHQAGVEMPDDDSVTVLNMRESSAEEIAKTLLEE